MKKLIQPQSRILKPIEELRELYRTRHELNTLINDTDPQPRMNKLTKEIVALQKKRADIQLHAVALETKVRPLIVRHRQIERRLKLLQNRKKVNQLLKLAARINP